MKITAIAVTSLDGRFTKGSGKNIYHWSSPEDFAHFRKTVEQHNLLVMGSGTFDPVKDIPEAGLKPEKGKLRIIMTKHPKKYKEFTISGEMEFTDETPKTLISRLGKKGYKHMLFVGGKKLLVSFLEAKLIDELIITIEPQIFGKGEILSSEKVLDIQLQLLETKKLNDKGTCVLRYKVVK